jgi:hypothetical protein
MALDTDKSAVDADTAAKPAAAGSVATDRAIMIAKMVWAMRCILVVSRNSTNCVLQRLYSAELPRRRFDLHQGAESCKGREYKTKNGGF